MRPRHWFKLFLQQATASHRAAPTGRVHALSQRLVQRSLIQFNLFSLQLSWVASLGAAAAVRTYPGSAGLR